MPVVMASGKAVTMFRLATRLPAERTAAARTALGCILAVLDWVSAAGCKVDCYDLRASLTGFQTGMIECIRKEWDTEERYMNTVTTMETYTLPN